MSTALHDDQQRKRTARDLALIVALTAVLTVPSMFTRDLWNPDEPRYMEVAREVFALPDYVIPHLNGQPYVEKPPLFFWLAGLLWKAGLGVMSARVLAAFSSLGTLLATYCFSRRFLKGDGPILATVATLGLLLFTAHARIGVIDPLHAFLLSATIMAGCLALRRAVRRPWLWWLLAYGLAGLDVLTKGPVGIALPGTVLLAYALLDRKRVSAGGKVHAAGAALLLAIVLAWLIPAVAIGGKAYAHALLLRKGLGYVVSSESHAQPFYYLILSAPVTLLPWSLLLALPVYAAVRHRREEDAGPAFFALVWCAATVVFFSCVSAKRVGYLLPMAPAVGILVGWYLTSGMADRHPRWRTTGPLLVRISLAALAVTTALLMAATFLAARMAELEELGPAAASSVHDGWWRLEALALLALPLICCTAGWMWARTHLQRAAVALALAVVLLGAWFDLSVAPLLNADKSARAFCGEIEPYLEGGGEFYFYNTNFTGAVNLYTGRAVIPMLFGDQDLRAALHRPGVLVLSDMRRYANALTEAELERYTIYHGHMGKRQVVLLRGRSAE